MLKKILTVLHRQYRSPKQWYSYFLPYTCILCQAPTQRGKDICLACEADLPWLKNPCTQCALELNSSASENSVCGNCLKNSPPYTRTLALWRYEQPIDYLITQFKFQQRLVYGQLMGELLAERLYAFYQKTTLPQCVIPMPLHSQRLRERGFNQSLELARPLIKKLNIPLHPDYCQRIRATAPQSIIALAERRRNIKDAFKIVHDYQLRHIAIVDDVITTGHTIEEISRLFRQAGVVNIDIWCCAKTQLLKNS